MHDIVTLNSKNLNLLRAGIKRPLYDRSKLIPHLVHIGVGGFHRSHQAFYSDALCQSGATHWSICGVGIMQADRLMKENLKQQECLYSLMVINPDGSLPVQVIGSITDYLFAPDNPRAVIEKLADPATKVVTLTITEGGYNFDHSGEFRSYDPAIQNDLRHQDKPVTVFGFLNVAMKLRMERGLPAFTVQSCDNIQHNGNITRKMILAFAGLTNGKLQNWIEKNVAFPNSMVDRITPVTTDENKEKLERQFGIADRCPVVCEPFCQWIIEDTYSSGRPAWEEAGAQFVTDVTPFEKMKIRLLNAGHSLLGFTGALTGYEFIHEAVKDELLRGLLRNFMDNEVTPVLDDVPGIDLTSYKNTLLERFGNSQIRDTVSRICSQSSAKIPKFLLPTVADRIRLGFPVNLSAFIVAAWCRYSEGIDEKGNKYDPDDEMKAVLRDAAFRSHEDNLAFLKIRSVFGDLIDSEEFKKSYSDALRNLYNQGIQSAVKKVMSDQKC